MAQEISTRDAYGLKLVELGRRNQDIVVLDADLSKSTMTHHFAKAFPDRFFDCGIAEQNMVTIAAGLAGSGKIPFASTFAVFLPGRCFDQVRMSIAQPGLNVKLVTTHSGISVGEDGISHQAIEDLALACALPGVTVIVPADAVETAQAIEAAVDTEGPFYIRLGRPKVPVVFPEDYRFSIGKAVKMRSGKDVAIIACGIMLKAALDAADDLQKEGIACTVLNMSTLQPVDADAIIEAANTTGAIVTAEEHLLHGGLGSIVARVTAASRPVPIEFIAMKGYAMSGKPDQLLERYGLTSAGIREAVIRVLKRK
ncbi:MAG: transketolase family protein [Dehalococcoidales bacterium]|nr:transketolase family protein [Dehalococcoidales bacterium]